MTFRTCIIVSAFLSMSSPLWAQDPTKPNIDETATGTPGGVAQYDMAQGLFALGLANKDALLALTAAKLAAGVQMTDVKRDGKQTLADGMADEPGRAAAPPDAAAMFAAAREFSAGDELLLELIDDQEAEGARGRIGGASRELSSLPAGAADNWKIPFYGESYAEIGISGDGDTPLAIVVTDEKGNRVGCPTRIYDKFYCDFVPRVNGYFMVQVTNTGGLRNSYYLLTN